MRCPQPAMWRVLGRECAGRNNSPQNWPGAGQIGAFTPFAASNGASGALLIRSENHDARSKLIDRHREWPIPFPMPRHPILWSFRRCPFAMRARLALLSSGVRVELREVLLRDKPSEFLETSPSATVPALRLRERVLDESLDIMIWALAQNDPLHLLEMPDDGWRLIETSDGPFKTALDHTKYASRFPDLDAAVERHKATVFLTDLDRRLSGQRGLFADRQTIADIAILPFVRQFANIDRNWFDAQDWPFLWVWLDGFTQSDDFARIMSKYAPWSDGDPPIWFAS